MRRIKFILTNEHIKLVQHINISSYDGINCGVDEVEPFGDSSINRSMCKILDIQYNNSLGQDNYLDKLYEDMLNAIAIICQYGHKIGAYTKLNEDTWKWFKDK